MSRSGAARSRGRVPPIRSSFRRRAIASPATSRRAVPRPIPADAAAATRSAYVLSSIGTPSREPRGAVSALDVARRQHGLARLRSAAMPSRSRRSAALRAATPPVAARRRPARCRSTACCCAGSCRRDRSCGPVDTAPASRSVDDRQTRALVRADGEQRAARVEILRLGRRRAVACR